MAGPVGRSGRDQAHALAYGRAELGERFGPHWATYWFRATAIVPQEWAGRRIDLLWDSASEATLWRDGRPVLGLNAYHRDAVLAEPVEGQRELTFEIELACKGPDPWDEGPVPPAELRRCELGLFEPDAWDLYLDFETPRALGAEHAHGLEEAWAGELLSELNRFCNVWAVA